MTSDVVFSASNQPNLSANEFFEKSQAVEFDPCMEAFDVYRFGVFGVALLGLSSTSHKHRGGG